MAPGGMLHSGPELIKQYLGYEIAQARHHFRVDLVHLSKTLDDRDTLG